MPELVPVSGYTHVARYKMQRICQCSGSDECAALRKSQDALRRHFGCSEFRPGQRDAIIAVQHAQDVFVQMATGAGKTLCMFIPVLAAHQQASAIIFSPLSGLIDQQVISKWC